jgi:hypothetical protein
VLSFPAGFFAKNDLADSGIGITLYDNLFKDYSVTGKSTISIMCLSDYIEVMEIGTPLTNMFFTSNPQGAIYGFDRDMPHLEAKTPIKGL